MSPFEIREFSNSQVRRAGEFLKSSASADSEQRDRALKVLDNYRALHYVPLNTVQATLRARLTRMGDTDTIVAQRIKRLPSILEKLERFPQMSLDRMQDIGGIRAIVPSVRILDDLYKKYTEDANRVTYQMVRAVDYVIHPKSSGYRGRHIVFKYAPTRVGMEGYKGLYIEMQLRTKLQHIWATAVETFEVFMGEKFKASCGNQQWLDFFALVSSAFAVVEEQPTLEAHAGMTREQLVQRVRRYMDELDVLNRIKNYSGIYKALSYNKGQRDSVAVVTLDTHEQHAQVIPFPAKKYEAAFDAYTREERRSSQDPSRQVVLVIMDSIQKLRKAYPNYFADLKEFRRHLINFIR